MAVNSSVARGRLEPPHWLVKYAKSHVFCAFEADFLWKIENSPPPYENSPPQTSELAKLDEKSVSISVKTFFFGEHLILGGKNLWICDFGRKITINFSEDLFIFYFFGEHLILGGKNLWISDFGRKITLNFSEDLFFFGEHLIFGGKNLWISELSEKFCLNFRTNRLKLIQVQWKFESRSFAQFSLFQNSPPPPLSKSWLRAWQWMSIWANISWIDSLNIVTKNLHN